MAFWARISARLTTSRSDILTGTCKADKIECASISRRHTCRWPQKASCRTARRSLGRRRMSFGFQLVHAKPNRMTTLVLSWILFLLGTGMYFYASQKRHRENPEDRVMPTVTQMFHGMTNAA